MTSKDNKALVERYYMRFYGQGEEDALDEVFSPDYIHNIPDVAEGSIDFDDFKKRELHFIKAFSGLTREIKDMIGERDKVVVRSVIRGRQTGDIPNIPASGKSIDVSSIAIYRVKDGMIVEGWENYDSLGMMMDLDVVTIRSTLSKKAHDTGHIQHLSRWPI